MSSVALPPLHVPSVGLGSAALQTGFTVSKCKIFSSPRLLPQSPGMPRQLHEALVATYVGRKLSLSCASVQLMNVCTQRRELLWRCRDLRGFKVEKSRVPLLLALVRFPGSATNPLWVESVGLLKGLNLVSVSTLQGVNRALMISLGGG